MHCRTYRIFDERKYQINMSNTDWEFIYKVNDLHLAAKLFGLMQLVVVNLHSPFHKQKLREFPPVWLNMDYISHVSEREFWTRRFKKDLGNLEMKLSIQKTSG